MESRTADEHDRADRLAAAVAELQTVLNRSDRSTAAELEIGSAEDLQVLRLLLTGPLRVGELARLRGASVTTASGRLDRLEKRGYVRKERIPGDRRAMVVTLTDDGRGIAEASTESRRAALRPIAERFPVDALDELIVAVGGVPNEPATS